MSSIPDLSDPLVRAMVDRNHVPKEEWQTYESGRTRLLAVRCEQCRQLWRCETRRALDEFYATVLDGVPPWEAELLERQARTVGEDA